MSHAIENARIVVGSGAVIERGALRCEGDRIVALGSDVRAAPGDQVLDARGRVLMPGFVDAHTHACFAGNRLDEFDERQAGATYLEILARGGGILSTVRAVREASEAELAAGLRRRLDVMLREGTTTVEVKSGYGLTTDDELKMLHAIRRASEGFSGTVVATALLGHALDPEQQDFVERVVEHTLPRIHDEFPAVAVDAYCEEGAWSVADCRRLFQRARELGHSLRLHADQFTCLGGLDLALEFGALSVDHLEATSHEGLERLARSSAFGVLLPASGFHLDDRYAAARHFLDSGGKLVVASNCNPGSSPTSSMPFVLALSVRKLRLSTVEALRAATSSAAALLGFADRGVLRPGARADFILLRHDDERALGYELGGNPVEAVFAGGERVV